MLVDPAEPVRFQPRTDGPVYYLRPPIVADRARYWHAVKAQGGRKWVFWDLARGVRAALVRLRDAGLYQADFDGWLADLDAYVTRVDEAAQALQADRNEETRAAFQVAFTAPAVVDEVFRLTRQCDQEVAAMMADNDQHALIAGTEAARMFLVGWEGLGRFGRGLGGATDASLWQIREGDLVEIGRHIAELLEPRPDVLGNSGSASSGSAAQPSSTTPATTPQTAPSADGTAGS